MHNFAGPLFAVSLVIVFFTFLRDNWPQRGDLNWLLKGGGMFSGGNEPPSHRFNAGEKVMFWGGVLFLGIIVVGLGPGARQADARPDLRARHDAGRAHGPRRGHGAHDVHVPRPHLPRHDRHAGRLHGHAQRLCRRDLGQGAPRLLVRRHPGRQDPGAAQQAADRGMPGTAERVQPA